LPVKTKVKVSPITTPAAAAIPPETALQHIESILGIIGDVLKVVVPIAAAVGAPFIHNANSETVESTELPIVEGTAGALAAL
jgi:hypothetical protein